MPRSVQPLGCLMTVRKTKPMFTDSTMSFNQRRLMQAAINGSVTELEKMFLTNPDTVFWKDSECRTVLHLASTHDKVAIIDWAVQNGVDINGQDKYGNTALHVSIECDALECMETLLQRGADRCIGNQRKQEPIHLATQLNKPASLQILLKHMARVDTLNEGEHGRTALHIAAIYDFSECAKILLTTGLTSVLRKICDNGYTPLHEAAKNSSAETLQLMLEWGMKMGLNQLDMMKYTDAEGNLPLHLAVHSGDIRVVKVCLVNGAKISNQQHDFSTPVHLACSLGEMEIVKLMFTMQPEEKLTCLETGDSQQMQPLHHAAMFHHTPIVDYLLAEGACINAVDLEHRTPLLLAASRCAWGTVQFLLLRGADISIRDANERNIIHYIVMYGGNLKDFTTQMPSDELRKMLNEKDAQGCTPLHYSSRGGQIRSTEKLIQLGACVNLKDKNNKSPLHFAARFGRYNTMMELLQSERGPCIINEADGQGLTPLHIASENGHTKIVQLLLAKGALLQRDHSGRTPLHLAALNGYTHTIELLLSVHSHLLDQVDKDGNTPLHLATQENQSSAITLLLSTNCKIKQNNANQTPMDLALIYKHSESAMAMATHNERADEVLKLNSIRSEGVVHSLIATMPEVFVSVLDQCITRSSVKQDSKSYFIKYNFKYLQYSREVEKEMESKNEGFKKHLPLPAMNTMVHYRRLELLCHPVCQKYIQMKWTSYGMYFHTANLLVYMIFVGFLTTFGVHLMSIVDVPLDGLMSLSPQMDIVNIVNMTIKNQNINNEKVRGTAANFLTAVIVMSFAVINVIKELVQFYQQPLPVLCSILGRPTSSSRDLRHDTEERLLRKDDRQVIFQADLNEQQVEGCLKQKSPICQRIKYIVDPINVLEWLLYISAGIMVMPLFTGRISDHHLTCAAIAVFIAWFNFLLYLQRFDRVGIYVVMFLEILKTLLKALMIFSILVVAFGLAFFILMSRGHHLGFSNVTISFIRVFSMMLGEFDFLGTFVNPYFNASSTATTLPYPHYSMGFLIIFMVFMPILLVNLLIGLAVGDIDSVRQNAYLKRLAMQVDLHTELERKLPHALLKRVDKEAIIEYPNSITLTKYPWVSSLITCLISIQGERHTGFATTFLELIHKWFGSVYTTEKMEEYGNNSETEYVASELHKHKQRLKEMSMTIQQLHQMVRLIVQKMEIRTEANDIDEGIVFNERKHSKWSSPSLNIKLRSVSALLKGQCKNQD